MTAAKTPETDFEQWDAATDMDRKPVMVVYADYARKLEQQRDALAEVVRDAEQVISRINLRRFDLTAAELKAITDTWLDRNSAALKSARGE